MKKFFKYFGFMAVLVLTSLAATSCSDYEGNGDKLYPYSFKEHFYGKWTLKDKTIEGSQEAAEAVPLPAWFSLYQEDNATYEHNGNVTTGMWSAQAVTDDIFNMGLFSTETAPGDLGRASKNYFFTAYRPQSNSLTLILEHEGVYRITLVYKK